MRDLCTVDKIIQLVTNAVVHVYSIYEFDKTRINGFQRYTFLLHCVNYVDLLISYTLYGIS